MGSWVQNIGRFAKRGQAPLAAIAFGLGLSPLLVALDWSFLESRLYDLRVRLSVTPRADSRIVLVEIDDPDGYAPRSLDQHALLLERLAQGKPAGVGYLVDLNAVQAETPTLALPDQAQAFLRGARRIQAQGGTFLASSRYDVIGEVPPPAPLDELPYALSVLHKDGNLFAEDRVTRRALVSLAGRPTFHATLAALLGGPSQGAGVLRGSYHMVHACQPSQWVSVRTPVAPQRGVAVRITPSLQ